MNGPIENFSRRDFLKTSSAGAAGLLLGVHFTSHGAAPASASSAAAFVPNAFVKIGIDSRVTVIAKHIEFGQGVFTGLATLIADELDADWQQINVQGAPANGELYGNLNWGKSQGTGGSSSINNAYTQMRRAGASARAMLINAAAKQWQVPATEITVDDGVIAHRSGLHARFGELAKAAAEESIPKNVTLKDPAQFKLIGKDLPRVDVVEKTLGTATYTQDLKMPGMKIAVVAHPPLYGAKVDSFDASTVAKMPGIERVFSIGDGVAIVGASFWQVNKARAALEVSWDNSNAYTASSAKIFKEYRELANDPGVVGRLEGDPDAAFENAAQIVEASYEFPFLAHASMEPMNCVVRLSKKQCEMWYGAQSISRDQRAAAAELGLAIEQVTINMLYAGGSFGRRASIKSDYPLEALKIAQQLPEGTPLKLVWTREDDMRAGFFRPLNYHALKAGLDADGNLIAWQHRMVGQTIFGDGNSVDVSIGEGATTLPYAIDNLRVDAHIPKLPVPVLWWRSVGHSQNGHSTESFIDELAHAAGRDPLAFRLDLLKHEPRYTGVLKLAAEKAGWEKPLAKGKGRGIAVQRAFKTYIAEVAEVSVAEDGSFSVDRVTVAVDCGLAINPSIIEAQMQSGIGYGLSAARFGAITLKDGYVEQGNFDGYRVLRINEMPEIDVHIVPSSEHPTGVGEPGTAPIAPAVANALFAATGQRYRNLPLG
ncbi:MAG: molybdopterin cofactor-binding domain-containing protein [Pseudomonadota bacterium]